MSSEMWFFRRRQEEREASLLATMTKAMGEALGNVFNAQSRQLEQSTAFLGVLNDLSAKKAAQVMGQRGGRTTAERKRMKKLAQVPAVTCRLCVNPMARGVTLQELDIHRQHEGAVRDAEAEAANLSPQQREN